MSRDPTDGGSGGGGAAVPRAPVAPVGDDAASEGWTVTGSADHDVSGIAIGAQSCGAEAWK